MSTPLNDLAPWPATEAEVTAETLLKHLTVCASAREHETGRLAQKALANDPTAEDVRRYSESFEVLAARFGVVFLLRQIQQQSSQDWADEVARHLWSLWQDGGSIPEFLWDWTAGYGIDPEQLETLAKAEQEGSSG
jgi:hypothetical protein